MSREAIKAVLWDFGGVILSSPFEAFNRYEEANGLPRDFIRSLNATNPDTNAWARFERSEVGFEEFCELFEGEARAAGHHVCAAEVIRLLRGELRPAMVGAIERCRAAGLKTALLSNNVAPAPSAAGGVVDIVDIGDFPTSTPDERAGVLALFDVIVESSKVGVRKPDPRFYVLACEQLGIEPHEAVFLDDLGVNLKPARALGMRTIKVGDPDVAIKELEALVGFPLG